MTTDHEELHPVLSAGETLLFVYGTLKSGGRANHLLAGQRLIGPASTIAQYRLYDLGSYPGLIFHPEEGVEVKGELWAVDAATLALLDDYECAPDLFIRREVVLLHVFEPVESYFCHRPILPGVAWGDRWPLPS